MNWQGQEKYSYRSSNATGLVKKFLLLDPVLSCKEHIICKKHTSKRAFRDTLKGRDRTCWFICECADRGAHAAGCSQLSITSSILQVNMLQTTQIRKTLLPQTRSGPKCAQLWMDQIKRIVVVLWAQCFILANVHQDAQSDTLHWVRTPLQLWKNHRMDLERGNFLGLLLFHCLSYPAHVNYRRG